ncbi:SCF E3 ubiquitin ligase complex F-box protein grrA [Smittium culicis]|uniref:SCF E3 ubiquitin ligase complex F-box protein grrA n=1 Tax=Smittium culicis TaxID=133412 RepID=A0A1R1YF14_9FUNG|nr:SCF E3 ubiquitin ligase complex F-box protein grrA [Smittium culicis]
MEIAIESDLESETNPFQLEIESRNPSTCSIYNKIKPRLVNETYAIDHSYPLKEKSSILILNTDILERIFSLISKKDLKNISMVCSFWNQTSLSILWKRMILPLDKRKLSAMKPVLNLYGRFVKAALVVPPIEILTASTDSSGILNIPVAGSKKRNGSWSLPKPLSRSDSISSIYSMNSRSPLVPFTKPPSILSKSPHLSHRNSLEDFKLPQRSFFLNPEDNLVSSFNRTSTSSRPDYDQNLDSSNSLYYNSDSESVAYESSSSYKNNTIAQNSTSYKNDFNIPPFDHPLNVFERNSFEQQLLLDNQRNLHNHSSLSNSSRMSIPIPGTPGIGNVLGSDVSLSPGNISKFNIDSSLNSSIGSSSFYSNRNIGVTRSTILRLQQLMECYCPNVTDLTILNPNGISSHDLRIEFLECLFSTYPNLLYLNLTDFIMWDSKALKLASTHLSNLRSLDVTNRVELRDEDLLPIIENCHHLSELHLRATGISDITISSIEKNIATNLKILDVGGCSVSSESMSRLLLKVKNLSELRAWSCLRLNDNFLDSLKPQNLKLLTVLDLMDIHSFSELAVSRAFGSQKWPNLKYLRIRSTCSISSFSGLPNRSVLKLNSTSILD